MNDRSRCSSRTSAHGIAKYVHHVANVSPTPASATTAASTVQPCGAVDDGVDRRDRADDPLAERDDHEQAVALGDVMRVPRRPAVAALGDARARASRSPISTAAIANVAPIGRSTIASTTQNDLRDRDRPDVGHRRRPPRRIVARRARPQEHHRHAHDDVAGDHHAVVEHVAVVDRRERLLEAEREHDHADHLHHRREAQHPVVGVVGRREPRVVDPRPGDGERREREADDPRPDVTRRRRSARARSRRPERDDERQVEEQLERRRGAVLPRRDRAR